MMTTAHILIFLCSSFGIYILLSAVGYCQESPHINKIKFWLLLISGTCISLIFLVVIYIHINANYYWYDLLADENINISLLLALFGFMAGYLSRSFANKMAIVWKEDPPLTTIYPVHIIYLGVEVIFIVLIGIGVYGLVGHNAIFKTPILSVDFTDKYVGKIIKQPSYNVKSERVDMNLGLILLSKGMSCGMEGDWAFYKLMNDTEAVTSIEASRPIIYQLTMLLQRAMDAQDAGESRQRIADKMSHVKAALFKLVTLNPENKNELDKLHGIISKLQVDLKKARGELQEVSDNVHERYSLPQREMKNFGWCTSLLDNHNGEAQKNNGFPLGRIPEIYEGISSVADLEKEFSKQKVMPHIYIIAAIMMWYDNDLHGAIRLLEDTISKERNAKKYIGSDPKIYILLHMMAQSDERPNNFIFKYSRKRLESLQNRLKIIQSNKDDTHDKNILINRYEDPIIKAKNDFAYDQIRQSTLLSFEETEKSLNYAKEVFSYNDNPGYIDTLGYVRMVAALRGHYGDDIDKKKHEIHEARLLLSRAYEIALKTYTDNYTGDDEEYLFNSLRLIEEHLRDAEKYSAELDM